MSLRARCALVLALGACLPTALPSAQHIRLSPSTLPVSTFLPIPEGSGVVFRVFESSQSNTLMRARLGFWPAPRDLQDVSHEASPGAYFVSPDARRLVYLTAYDPFDYFLVELYSQPLDGSAPPVKLNGPLNGANDDVEWFVVSPDGERVLYLANQETGLGVYSAPIDGSTPAARIDGPLAVNAVLLFSPDGHRVIYREAGGARWTVPSDASAPAVQVPGTNIGAFVKVSSDSARIFYSAQQGTGPRELYSAPVDASAPPVRISAPLVSGGQVEELFALTLDGTRVVYAADQEVNNRLEVYIAPIDGSGASLKLSAPVVLGVPRADVSFWNVVVSDSRAVYQGYLGPQSKLLSVPLDGSAAPVEIASFPRSYASHAALGRVHFVYGCHAEGTLDRDLYSAPLDGSAPPVRLNGPLPPGGDVVSFVLDRRGEHALFLADQEINEFFELYWVPLDGSWPARKVNRPGVHVDYGFSLTADGMRALYVGDPGDGVPGVFLDTLRTRPGAARR